MWDKTNEFSQTEKTRKNLNTSYNEQGDKEPTQAKVLQLHGISNFISFLDEMYHHYSHRASGTRNHPWTTSKK